MNFTERKPIVVPPGEGKKLMVIGQEILVRVGCADTAGELFVFDATSAPGSGVPPHIHLREDEMLQVLEGEMEVFLDGKTFVAKAGSVCFFPRNIPHGFKNMTNRPVQTRFVVSPGRNFEAFFNEFSALPAQQPPDMRKVTEIFDRYGIPLC
jgi:quercetin dioxygenase-like cupin family protein